MYTRGVDGEYRARCGVRWIAAVVVALVVIVAGWTYDEMNEAPGPKEMRELFGEPDRSYYEFNGKLIPIEVDPLNQASQRSHRPGGDGCWLGVNVPRREGEAPRCEG